MFLAIKPRLDRTPLPSLGWRIAPGGAQAGPRCNHSALQAQGAGAAAPAGALASCARPGQPGHQQQELLRKMLKFSLAPEFANWYLYTISTGSALSHVSGLSNSANVNHTKLYIQQLQESHPVHPEHELRSRNSAGGEQWIYLARDSNTT